ncbi:MAG: hypothetical protein D3924_06395 [Candidatus Electrothrix sp. AR4]|nr:hypothetical protein [Candidatus Electrothrix sp. AR4]
MYNLIKSNQCLQDGERMMAAFLYSAGSQRAASEFLDPFVYLKKKVVDLILGKWRDMGFS